MIRKLALFAWALNLGLNAVAATPPPEQLLPIETVAVFTLPDVAKARAAGASSAMGQFWADPAMKPFREKLVDAVNEELIAPLERELGVRLSDYHALAQGQLTLAWVRTGNSTNASTGWLLLNDTRDKANDLGLQLTGLRKKWTATSQPLRIEKFQAVEFTTLTLSNASLATVAKRAFAGPGQKEGGTTNAAPAEAETPGSKIEFTFGLSGSLLIVASDTNLLQGILTRQGAAGDPALRDHAEFQKEHQARFRESLFYGWVDLKPLADTLIAWAEAHDSQTRDEDPKQPMPKRSKLLAVTGLTAAQRMSFAWNGGPGGNLATLDLSLPPTNRIGVFKLIEFETQESGPPQFVPAAAVRFQRWRLNLPNVWTTLEQMLTEVFPTARGVMNFLLQTAGKDSDPNLDLKAELLGNLGDDLISYELAPRTNTLADLSSPPSLSLLASTNSERLVLALKAAAALFPPPLANVTEREVQGRKLYSLSLPSLTEADGTGGGERSLTFGATTNFVALSTDTNLLAAALGGTNHPSQPLRDLPGLAEAAQTVGGMGTGLFGYQNTVASTRILFDALKQYPESALTLMPPEYLLALTGLRLEEPLQRILAKCDFALLPAFDQVAKYFHFTVYAASVDAEGFRYRRFSPVPPALAKPAEPTPTQSPSK